MYSKDGARHEIVGILQGGLELKINSTSGYHAFTVESYVAVYQVSKTGARRVFFLQKSILNLRQFRASIRISKFNPTNTASGLDKSVGRR